MDIYSSADVRVKYVDFPEVLKIIYICQTQGEFYDMWTSSLRQPQP